MTKSHNTDSCGSGWIFWWSFNYCSCCLKCLKRTDCVYLCSSSCVCQCILVRTHRPSCETLLWHSPSEPLTDALAPSQDTNMLLSVPLPVPPPPPSSPFPSSVLPYPNSAKVTEEFCSRWISRPSTHRAIFSPGNLEHVGHRKDFLLTRGNHGNWHWPQGPVSRYLNALNHTPPPRSRRRSSEEGGVGVQRATWLFSGRPCDWWRRNSAAFLVRCCGWMLTSVWGCSREPPLGREG